MIFEILRAANIRAGLYTSPDLDNVRERIRCSFLSKTSEEGADWIEEDEFAESVSSVREAIEALRESRDDFAPTYFEVLTAASFVYFAKKKINVGVYEVGLGGRLDSTNVLEPSVCVICPIGFDHAEILGSDLASIAGEKAGIIKPGCKVIIASSPKEAADVIRNKASSCGCQTLEYGLNIFSEVLSHAPSGLCISVDGFRGSYADIKIPMLGRHQAQNASLAIAAVEALSDSGTPYHAIRKGLSQVRWRGRIEVLQEAPLVIVDGGHNAQAMQALVATVQELWPRHKKHFLFGLSSDKSPDQIGQILGQVASSIICTKSSHPRAMDPNEIAKSMCRYVKDTSVIQDPADAFMYRINTSEKDDLIIISGSFFLAGEFRSILNQIKTKDPHFVMQTMEGNLCR
jgi:dihydrofolate synthase/folylpolyglutamate synthase